MAKIHSHNSKSVKDFLNLGGSIRDNKVAMEKSKEFTSDPDILEIVGMYYTLLADTNYLRNEVYDFLVLDKTYDEIIKEYDFNRNYIRTLIYNENNRLFKDLGGYDIFALLQRNEFTAISKAVVNKVLTTLLTEREDIQYREKEITVGKADIVKKVFLDEKLSVQPNDFVIDRRFNAEVTDEAFNRLLNIIKSLSLEKQQELIDKVDGRYLGYLQYLYTSRKGSLTKLDIQRKEYLTRLVGGDSE